MKVRLVREWNWWPINRPQITRWWISRHDFGFVLGWGNGNSDNVWSLGIEVHR